MNLLVIGGGNMGHTYALSIKESLEEINISILEAYPPKVEELRNEGLFEIYTNAEECVGKTDIIMLAVKPQHSQAVFDSIREQVNGNQLVISIMAGIKISTIQASLNLTKVVRAMPNLPAQLGKGMTTYCPSSEVSSDDKIMVKSILDSTGKSIMVKSENDIDASTGISGSGPAYVFYFMQSMMQAAIQLGFSAEEAKLLVSQTFDGAVSLYKKNNLTTEEWINRVASKGGTTRAALDSFENNDVQNMIIKGAIAAYDRAVELGKDC